MKIKQVPDRMADLLNGSIDPMPNTPDLPPPGSVPAPVPAAPPMPVGKVVLPAAPAAPRKGDLTAAPLVAPVRAMAPVQILVKVGHKFLSKTQAREDLQVLASTTPGAQLGQVFEGGLTLAGIVPAETGRVYEIIIREAQGSAPSPKRNPYNPEQYV